jgi:hypothetical protein
MNPKREKMSKAGKKIMDKRQRDFLQSQIPPILPQSILHKRQRDFLQSQISSSLPQSILRPDSPKAVRVTRKEESGSPAPSLPSNEDPTPSSEITINGVPIKYDPLVEDGKAIVVHNGDIVASLKLATGDDEAVVIGTEEMRAAVEKSRDVGCTRILNFSDELAPAFEPVKLEDFVAEEVKPGPLTMEDAIELGDLAGESIRSGPENVCDCCGEEELIDKESSDGKEESPELAEVHEGTTQGGSAEIGRGDEGRSLERLGDSVQDPEQVD